MGSIQRYTNLKGGLTTYTVEGSVTSDEIVSTIRNFYEKGPVTRDVLWDVSQADLLGVDADDIRRISQVPLQSPDRRKGGKTAIVAPADLAYGLSRMYQSSSKTQELPFTVKVFRDTDKAKEWLAEINSRKQ